MAKLDRITFDPNVPARRAEEIDVPRVPTERSGVVRSWDLWNPSHSSGNAIVECTEPRDGLQKAILAVFADEHRSGRPARITAEQQAQLVALACEHPNPDECPVAHRSSEDLAREAVKRGIVDSISARHLRDILKRNDVRPHRYKH